MASSESLLHRPCDAMFDSDDNSCLLSPSAPETPIGKTDIPDAMTPVRSGFRSASQGDQRDIYPVSLWSRNYTGTQSCIK